MVHGNRLEEAQSQLPTSVRLQSDGPSTYSNGLGSKSWSAELYTIELLIIIV